MGVALVTKCVVNACPRSAILVVHFIVGAVADPGFQKGGSTPTQMHNQALPDSYAQQLS